MRVGVIGLGGMGRRVAARLLAAGHEVHVWTREPGPAQDLEAQGARAEETPAQLAAEVDALLTVLTDDEAVREVVLDSGLLAALHDEALYADLSTTSIELALELAATGREAGVDVLDVAMSGSTPQAEAGELVLLVGGDPDVLDRFRPLLDPLAKTIIYMGVEGAGTKMKITVNTLLGDGMQALAEAIALGEAVGLERERLLDGLAQTAVVAPAHRSKLENAKHDEYPPTFPLALMHKDFGLVLDAARNAGLDLPATAASARACETELEQTGDDDVDFSVVIRLMEEQVPGHGAGADRG
jgi:3-hydroxyisobutyrate dehydrogenase-like beta-hydroxyacid dehydrogenase